MKRNKANTEKQCFMKWHVMGVLTPPPTNYPPPPHKKKKNGNHLVLLKQQDVKLMHKPLIQHDCQKTKQNKKKEKK